MKVKPVQSIIRLKTVLHLTPAGKAMVMSMGFVLLAAAIIPAFGVFSCLLAILLCSLLFGLMFKPRISIVASLPDQVSVGSEVDVVYRIKNTSATHSFCLSLSLIDLPAGWLHCGCPGVIPHLKPMETEIVTVTLTPTRRGLFTLPCPACYSSFPFHLFAFNVARGPGAKITVLPAHDYIQLGTLSQSMNPQYAGSSLCLAPSHLPEYAGNRPFLSGDSLRHIDSRAWARLAKPVVKEYHNDMQRHCVLWLTDYRTSKPPASHWDRSLEAAVSLCASLAYSFGHNTMVDYLVIGQTPHDVHDFNGEMRLAYILDQLAHCVPAPGPRELDSSLMSRLDRVSCVYALYLGPRNAMDALRQMLGPTSVDLHTLHVSETPDIEAGAASTSERHWEIDANAILENQVTVL
ncbi:MAG: DUF58 domain-containing protein [Planctomycetes bacterium]|nr:DUF58 domain-containing protein [Planctomycetota bacterium]